MAKQSLTVPAVRALIEEHCPEPRSSPGPYFFEEGRRAMCKELLEAVEQTFGSEVGVDK